MKIDVQRASGITLLKIWPVEFGAISRIRSQIEIALSNEVAAWPDGASEGGTQVEVPADRNAHSVVNDGM